METELGYSLFDQTSLEEAVLSIKYFFILKAPSLFVSLLDMSFANGSSSATTDQI